MTELLEPRVLSLDLLRRAEAPLSVMQPDNPYPEISTNLYGMSQMIYSYRSHQVISHTGGQPGQYSVLIRVPRMGIALMIATNDEVFGPGMFRTVANLVLDELLGLTPIDWEDRFLGQSLRSPRTFPRPSRDTQPPPLQERIAGTYSASGYGDITLRPIAISDLGSDRILAPLREILALEPSNATIFVAELKKVFASHLILTPFEGREFNWTTAFIKPLLNEYGETGEYGLGDVRVGSAVFERQGRGFGMFGNFWGAGIMAKASAVDLENIEGSSEVWFEKIQGHLESQQRLWKP